MRRVPYLVLAVGLSASAAATLWATERVTAPAARHLSGIEVLLGREDLVVTLAGDGTLRPRVVGEANRGASRLVIDLPEVVAAVPMNTRVDIGPIETIRIEPHEAEFGTTRVVFDLFGPTAYYIDRDRRGDYVVRVVFPVPGGGPVTQLSWGVPPRSSHRPVEPLPGWNMLGYHVGRLAAPLTPVFRSSMLMASAATSAKGLQPSGQRIALAAALGQPPQSQLQPAGSGGSREYTGDPVSMDFQSADLRAVLRTFAEISGLNIVIDPQVDGTVDVSLRDVPWDQALDIILRTNQLGYLVDGTVVRIAPLIVLADEEVQRRKLADERALSGDLVVMTRTLSYARAPQMAQIVTTLLSARGQVQTDERTNTMIITDLADRLQAAEDLLDTLDRAEPQVEIEARIVQAGRDFARAIGVQWGITGRVAPDLGNTTPLTFPNRGGVTGRAGTQGPEASGADARSLPTENSGTAVNLPVTNPTSALGLTLGSVDGALNLDVVLTAAEGDGQVRLLSHPRVTTQNNVQAEIVQGDQIPIQVVANNTVTVQFQDAALVMRVTPQITAAQTVIMQIEIENDFADFGREVGGIPPIKTQRARTTVQVASGATTVIGGIFESEQSSASDRVPGLHRIPLLGWLFKSRSDRESTDELLIFLTPRIVP